jgi:endonuclease/exonuclease/phosphatase (EEP) superfamily protein YafD
MKNYFVKLYLALIGILAWGLTLATLAGFLGKLWWIFDLASHFRVQYLVGSLILGFASSVERRRWTVLAVGVSLLINLILVIPFYFPVPVADGENIQYRVLYANVLTENQQHTPLRELIQSSDPDFVALLEVNQAWIDDLNLPALGYSYSIVEARSDNFGVALYSRVPIKQGQIHRFGRRDIPTIVATMSVDDTPLTLVLTHPTPPKSEKTAWHRNIHMRELAEFVSDLDGNIILAGDLNSSSWSPFFRDWLEVSQLDDSRRGFGIQATWPTNNRLLHVPIDHYLTSDRVQVQERQVGPKIGSDHFPLLMDFSILEKNGEN